VTGTLFSDTSLWATEVEIFAPGNYCEWRLQTGGKSVERAEAGQRTAVNLAALNTQPSSAECSYSLGALRRSARGCAAGASARRSPLARHRCISTLDSSNNWRSGTCWLAGAARGSALAQIPFAGRGGAGPRRRFMSQFSPVVTIVRRVLDPLARRFRERHGSRAQFLTTLEKRLRQEICGRCGKNIRSTAEEIMSDGLARGRNRACSKNLADKNLIRIVSNQPLILMMKQGSRTAKAAGQGRALSTRKVPAAWNFT